MIGRITDVPGVLVGAVCDKKSMTGVTVVLFEGGATFYVRAEGPASTTRQIDAGRLDHIVGRAHAVCLAGGSAFGLGASTGVMEYLAERGVGNNVRGIFVPTVPTAAIFDLGLGEGTGRPDPAMARKACENAGQDVPRGSVGAGCGATVGKSLGPANLMKGGQGTASCRTKGGVVVGALAVVNAYGDVVDPDTGEHLAGARDPDDPGRLAGVPGRYGSELPGVHPSPIENTTLAVVAVGADLSRPALARAALMATAGLARALIPSPCAFDGDVLFALATGGPSANENEVGHLAAVALGRAIADAARSADGFGRVPDRGFLSGNG